MATHFDNLSKESLNGMAWVLGLLSKTIENSWNRWGLALNNCRKKRDVLNNVSQCTWVSERRVHGRCEVSRKLYSIILSNSSDERPRYGSRDRRYGGRDIEQGRGSRGDARDASCTNNEPPRRILIRTSPSFKGHLIKSKVCTDHEGNSYLCNYCFVASKLTIG